jgi:tRNA threonylcarbamoyladenosine biosynthesis protein TsaE
VVLLSGEVGTGKTTFVRGACRALGVEGPVASPSFTIGRVHDGRVRVAHLDLFRLESLEAEDPALLADHLGPDTVTFVEWPEAGAPELEGARIALRLTIAHAGGDTRRIEADGDPALVERLRDALEDAPPGDAAGDDAAREVTGR